MSIVYAILLALVVAVLGFWLLVFPEMLITFSVAAVLRFINRWFAYMVSRYLSVALDCVVLAWIIVWAGDTWGLITWPAWLVAGYAIFTSGNTLLFFDLDCYLTETGAWRKPEVQNV
jgi:hypothetical protein